MAKYDNNATYQIAGIYSINAAAPIDSRSVVASKKDLLLRSTFPNNGKNMFIYQGMQVYVEETKQIYVLTNDKIYTDFYESKNSVTDEELSSFGWTLNGFSASINQKEHTSTDDTYLSIVDEDDECTFTVNVNTDGVTSINDETRSFSINDIDDAVYTVAAAKVDIGNVISHTISIHDKTTKSIASFSDGEKVITYTDETDKVATAENVKEGINALEDYVNYCFSWRSPD